ncbi:hypothetical protein [Lactobacillus intestinalis]|uniref:hypothetical protein n=1 Tax=Lactobacillus intestinalis TaxID=151781 RepID=UPI000E952648|nr:hypothetical protein [Lactobacillus intestinalis]HBN37351.1 hypothetical protein [Lactobacillus johnsonii]
MDTETQSFQPESSNPALGLQGVTTSLYAKGRRKKGGKKHYGSYHSNISVLCDHNSFWWFG